MNSKIKILTNVFINSSGNNFYLANIYFDDKIRKIEHLNNFVCAWDEISSIESRNKIPDNIQNDDLPSESKIIDGKFNLAIPGCIDPHVHFDTPGFEFRDTFEHGSTAAAYGGVTSVIDMPCTSIPPVTSQKNFLKKYDAVKNRSLIDFAFWGGVCRNDFENGEDIEKNINELNDCGVASYKAYLISGMDTFKDLTFDQMNTAAVLIGKTCKPLGVHAEDKSLIESRRSEYRAKDLNTWEYYCSARDDEAEEKAVINMAEISRMTGSRVHIVHLSSAKGLNRIKEARKEGVNISAETCSHYLHFTQDDFKNDSIRNFLKTAPPVKLKSDKDALWKGISDGSLNFVTTDHAGCNPDNEKKSQNFWEVYGGIPGVEHRVPYLISEGFMNGKLNMEQTIKLLSSNAAEFFNLSSKGKIEERLDADFALINLWKNDIVKSENMHSKGKFTPFENMTFNCRVEKTILRGKVVMSMENDVDESLGYGKFIEVK